MTLSGLNVTAKSTARKASCEAPAEINEEKFTTIFRYLQLCLRAQRKFFSLAPWETLPTALYHERFKGIAKDLEIFNKRLRKKASIFKLNILFKELHLVLNSNSSFLENDARLTNYGLLWNSDSSRSLCI